MDMQTATFGAGCFWGVEAAFRSVDGVLVSRVGYSGGHAKEPTYRQVCGGGTGHAEAVEVQFDPSKVSYEHLLDLFWKIHDPTTRNRQGPDVGEQYRSAIFFHSREQEVAARRSSEELDRSGLLARPVVTEIAPAGEFWSAEDYHQRYFERMGVASCHVGFSAAP